MTTTEQHMMGCDRRPVQMTVGALTNDTLVAARYATRSTPRTLYHSNDTPTLKRMYPDLVDLRLLPGDAHAIMSEPLGTVPGAWSEVPASTTAHITRPGLNIQPFSPAQTVALPPFPQPRYRSLGMHPGHQMSGAAVRPPALVRAAARGAFEDASVG
jgi:hypothetical protein